MKKQFTFIESMIKVGVIGFGGGNALIPVLEQEVVNEKKLVSKDEYDKSVIAATLTPGALPVEIASGIGLHVGGIGTVGCDGREYAVAADKRGCGNGLEALRLDTIL